MTRVLGGGRPNYSELLNPQTDEARQRVQQLRDKLKMDPALMKKADDLYGPLEWRLPEASAIYWATVGLENSNKKDLIALRRVIYQSLQMSVLRGRIVLVRPDESLVFGPDLSKIGLANDGYEKILAEESEKPEVVQRAHRNFLKEAIFLLYMHNRTAEADRWMTVLKQKYPAAVPNQVSVEQYALERLAGTITEINHNKTKALIEGLLTQYFENLAVDNDDRAEGVLRMARQVWTYYDSSIQARREQLKLDPFEEMYGRIRDQLLDPNTGMLPAYSARLRTRLRLPAPAAPKTNLPPSTPKQP
jgi:hypothetical protein